MKDYTLSCSHCRLDNHDAVNKLSRQLVEEWGEAWQVNFLPKKMQVMVILRSSGISQAIWGRLVFVGKSLPFQDHVKFLGLSVDRELRFDHHIASAARQASLYVFVLRGGKSWLKGILTLYKVQIWPCMEYGALSWMLSAATHKQSLDAVQWRDMQLVTKRLRALKQTN